MITLILLRSLRRSVRNMGRAASHSHAFMEAVCPIFEIAYCLVALVHYHKHWS